MDLYTERFVEAMGLQFEADALPRTAGRVFGLLLVSTEPQAIEEMADALGVSRTSVGDNVRLMERTGAIERVVKPGDRRDHFRITQDILGRLLAFRLDRLRNFRAAFEEGLQTPGAGEEAVRHRIEAVCALLDHAIEGIVDACEADGVDVRPLGAGA